jgi:outer membrane immunogenic protein
LQADYNFQVNNFVYGVEADFGALNLEASRQGSGVWPVGFPPAAFTTGSSVSTDWLFTTRARLGWATSNVLIYATAGLALTDLRVSFTSMTSRYWG